MLALAAAPGCSGRATLTEQIEARRIAADLHVQFTKAAEAGNRAVMADTDEASVAAAREAEQATAAAQQDVDRLTPLLQSLAYQDEIHALDAFKTRFAEFRRLDGEILPLAVENTNLKAQRLSFGPGREAADAFREALDRAARSAASAGACCVDAQVARGAAAVLEVQVVEARHIAESDEAAMSRMEAEIVRSQAAAKAALDALQKQLPRAAAPHLDAAAAALDRFQKVAAEIVSLSRRNSNVRSLALSLGRKRTVTAECDDQLRALADALGRHELKATR
jgi:hypothetical protein